MKTKRRLKKSVRYALIIIIIFIIFIIAFISYIKHINKIDYKLKKLGYNDTEIATILKLDNNQIEDILSRDYSVDLVNFLNETYFIYDNLDKYLAYKTENKSTSYTDTVALVNVSRDTEFYTDVKKTDTSLENLMLVNKYNALDKDFKFDDLTEVSNWYAYGTQYVREEVYSKFKEMFTAAKAENLTIIINSSYRTYEYQENLWNSYADKNGDDWADSYAARAGHSEHQTGLSIDVTTYGVVEQGDFETTDEYKWLSENAYKYGFILRYPKGKEDITGYSYESWHYRYVGEKIAKEIYEKNITFDEYYAYYIAN
jgi:D-alanyl-D-alanine carboxypeptidase